MATHNITMTPSTYKSDVGHFKSEATFLIKDSSRSGGPGGWGLGCWDETGEGRLVSGGDMVRGPCAFLYGLCSVIDNNGGTGRLHSEALANGLLFRVESGDTLVMEGTEYTLTLDGRGYPHLTVK